MHSTSAHLWEPYLRLTRVCLYQSSWPLMQTRLRLRKRQVYIESMQTNLGCAPRNCLNGPTSSVFHLRYRSYLPDTTRFFVVGLNGDKFRTFNAAGQKPNDSRTSGSTTVPWSPWLTSPAYKTELEAQKLLVRASLHTRTFASLIFLTGFAEVVGGRFATTSQTTLRRLT